MTHKKKIHKLVYRYRSPYAARDRFTMLIVECRERNIADVRCNEHSARWSQVTCGHCLAKRDKRAARRADKRKGSLKAPSSFRLA